MRYLFLPLLFLFLLCTGVRAEKTTVNCPNPSSDYLALVAFYNATNGPNWTNDDGWADGVAGNNCDVCSWRGIRCENGNVIRIALIDNNLTGIIPSEIGQLANLKSLLLHRNSISGGLPTEIANLTSLNQLIIMDNDISGPFPDLSTLTELRVIQISTNNFNGPLPILGSMPFLLELQLGGNNFSGSIPSAYSPENFPSLIGFILSFNELTGTLPPILGSFSALERIGLGNNLLSGSLPLEWGDLTTLTTVDLGDNQLSGPLPDDWGNLTNVINLQLDNNRLEGCYPSSWITFCNLVSPSIGLQNNNGLSDGGSYEFFTNQFCGAGQLCGDGCHPDYAALIDFYTATDGPAGWTNKTGWDNGASGIECDVCDWYGVTCVNGRVTEIELESNGLTGDISALRNLPMLISVDLNSNDLFTSFPNLSGLTDLEAINFFSCELTGNLNISDLSGLPNLRVLNLNMNSLDGTIPDFTGFINIKEVLLSRNAFTGGFPASLLSIEGIVIIGVASNQLTGGVPDISNLPALRAVFLNVNEFNGSLPELINLPALTNFWCRVNSFQGDIPNSYNSTNLPIINQLLLNANQLSGSLPTGLGSLSTVSSLHLNGNNFSGCYPVEYSGLCNVTSINFQNPDLPDGGSTTFFRNNFCNYGAPCATDCPPNLLIESNADLTDFASVWPNCEELPGNLTIDGPITGNPIELRQLTRVAGTITYRNGTDSRLRGIENVTYCGGLIVEDWSNLIELGGSGVGSAFDLDSIDGPLTLRNLPDLENIEELEDASYITSITVENTGLIGLNPLRNTKGITDLTVINNADMVGVFPGVIDLGRSAQADDWPLENLTVSDNAIFASLRNIPAEIVATSITITNNVALADCSVEAVCNGLAQPSTVVNISGNAGSCADEPEARASCGFLPVTWLSFTATASGKTVNLAWTTASEENNDYFAAERSTNGRTWVEIGHVPALEAAVDGPRHYVYTDDNPTTGEMLYRLRQVDLDGVEDFSEVRRVFIVGAGASVFPNPAGGNFTLISEQSQVVTLHTADGRTVRSVKHLGARTQVQRRGLKSGVYWLRFSASGEVLRVVIK